jgi:hypothetical protein
MVSISVRNNTNASFYARHGRRSSLLIHPHGLELLQYYADMKQKPMSDEDSKTAVALSEALNKVIGKIETEVSTALRKVLKDEWKHAGKFSVTGEREESVKGTLSDSSVTGDPDAVIRMTPVSGKVDQKKLVMLALEVSVDGNGGEKKIGQAFDFSSLIDDPNETILIFTLHVDRRKDDLKITQEAFIYLHSKEEGERKIGFLWREVYGRGANSNLNLEFLKNSCRGIVRCLKCTEKLCDISSTAATETTWDLVSDNVAIATATGEEGEKHVFKIFDNRFHPTYRKPDVWLKNDYQWIKELEVEKYLEFEEGFVEEGSVEVLGKPANVRKRPNGAYAPNTVSYPKGSVLVIKYKFVRGTHFASRASHFQEIATCIKSMHKKGIVHADIRGFNMLHPVPGGIEKSCLIDFDLCGSPEEDQYPPGYASEVKDNVYPRYGREGSLLEKVHDWCELASVMAHYTIGDDHVNSMTELRKLRKAKAAWGTLVKKYKSNEGEDAGEFATRIDAFISEHGDVAIEMSSSDREDLEERMKGTGSPDKKRQKSRGTATIEQS